MSGKAPHKLRADHYRSTRSVSSERIHAFSFLFRLAFSPNLAMFSQAMSEYWCVRWLWLIDNWCCDWRVIDQLVMARSRTSSGGERKSPRHTGTGSFKESGMEMVWVVEWWRMLFKRWFFNRRKQSQEVWAEHQEDCQGGGGAKYRWDWQSYC